MCVHMCVRKAEHPKSAQCRRRALLGLENSRFPDPKGQGNQSKCLLKTPVPRDVSFRGCG